MADQPNVFNAHAPAVDDISCEAIEKTLTSLPPVHDDIASDSLNCIKVPTDAGDEVIEFQVPAIKNRLIDLTQSYFVFTFKIVTTDDKKLDPKVDLVTVQNFPAATLFENVTFELNSTNLAQNTKYYGLTNYLLTTLMYNDAKNALLTSGLFYADTSYGKNIAIVLVIIILPQIKYI